MFVEVRLFLLWHPSLGTSWLNISSSVRSRSDLYLFSANRHLSEEKEEEEEEKRERDECASGSTG